MILYAIYSLSGHLLEYSGHLYSYAKSHPEKEFVFAFPVSGKKRLEELGIAGAPNVSIYFIDEKTADWILNTKNLLLKSYRYSKDLGRLVKLFAPDEIILINLVSYLPFIVFFVGGKTKIRGIIYNIYLYSWKNSGLRFKFLNALMYTILARFKCFDRLFVLNDEVSARLLNRLYSTRKFAGLPDPFNADVVAAGEDSSCDLSKYKRVFLHFGGLDYRKGTVDILDSIGFVPADLAKDFCFVFLGRVYDGMKEEFYRKAGEAAKKTNVLVFDKTSPLETVFHFFKNSDCVLIPYKNVNQSSGVLGYGAYFNKPVISGGRGLLGRLVKKNRLGLALDELTPENLAAAYSSDLEAAIDCSCANDYVKRNSVGPFLEKLFEK